jgi:hypothetical protein
MANTQNSISSLISQFLMLQKNSLEIINKLSEAATSTKPTVDLEQLNTDNTSTIASIPSWGYLLNRLNSLDNTVQTMAGLGSGVSNIRNADGSVSQIYKATPLMDPPAPSSVQVPASFST